MPTILDVAREAGVSISTASVVINNKCSNVRVSERTRKRVQDAVARLGYRPNVMARGLRLKRSGLIGVVVGNIEYSTMPAILQGIEVVAKRFGYNVMLGMTDHKDADEKYYLELLHGKKVDGIIVAPASASENIEAYQDILREGFPCVFVAHRRQQVNIPYVLVDGKKLGYTGTEHLIQYGHRRIAFLGHTEDTKKRRLSGYCKALQAYGINFDADLVESCGFGRENGYEAMQRLWKRNKDFTAVYAHDDTAAAGVIACMKKLGLNVPEDISLVGSDDLAIAAMLTPALTTVAQPKCRLGEIAAEMLLDLIEEKNVSSQILEPELVIRESTRKIAGNA
ncbi:MAG: LacI family DNA-binding transcriptional regulator [bacterium]|jgi:LacI family transcriptional regulator|nr:LacI family DNA-binding transcriptional regulator [bacterium]MDD3805467.1 LacI family DNA-binding transcriptional regulator [bacterium]MDD4152816.1 LacI family DNA-binding transcriptional regulator [bacterium]MDD4557815.1 LacI family DNA-binding transcriptional regulator [bacterium]